MFQVMSVLPFSAKNAFMTASLLESSLARFKDVVCCFQTISCLLSFKGAVSQGFRCFRSILITLRWNYNEGIKRILSERDNDNKFLEDFWNM